MAKGEWELALKINPFKIKQKAHKRHALSRDDFQEAFRKAKLVLICGYCLPNLRETECINSAGNTGNYHESYTAVAVIFHLVT